MVAADAEMPGLPALGRLTAIAAEPVPFVPVQDALGIGEKAALVGGQKRSDAAEVDKDPAPGEGRPRLRILDMDRSKAKCGVPSLTPRNTASRL